MNSASDHPHFRLNNFLKSGELKDNQNYGIKDKKIFSNQRKLASIAKYWGCGKQNSEIWDFLTFVSQSDFAQAKSNVMIQFRNKEYEHNTPDKLINISGKNAQDFSLSTGNLIGFIKKGAQSLKISSRFGDAFLKFVIADADGFLEIEKLGGQTIGDGYQWLLAYLWSVKLRKAYRLGLPKAYQSKHEQMPRVRGSVDALDYFQNRSTGKYLCNYREHSFKHPALSLFLKAHQEVKKFGLDINTRSIISALLVANQGERQSKRELLNTPYYHNPFYADYNEVIDLSKQILRRRTVDFSSQNEISAYLFDVSMLFEYFIRKALLRSGVAVLPKSRTEHRIPAAPLSGDFKRKIEPDLVIKGESGLFIFDVKYKRYDARYGVKREDIFQMHTYVGQYGNQNPIEGCGFIYPISDEQWKRNQLGERHGMVVDHFKQQGKSISFAVFFLRVPNNDIEDFGEVMKNAVSCFCDAFRGYTQTNEDRAQHI